MKIIICRANEVEKHIAEQKIDAVLSIQHPEATEGVGLGQAPELKDTEQRIFEFWDIEDDSATGAPTEDDLRQTLAYLDELKSRFDKPTIIVHCHGGKARSVAVVLAYLAKEFSVQEAVEIVKIIRPIAGPNILMVKHADKILGFNGALIAAVEADELFTKNRADIEKRRQYYAEKYPDRLAKMYPEKIGQKPPQKKKDGFEPK